MNEPNNPIRNIQIYGNSFWIFYEKQTKKVQERILWTLRLIRDVPVVPARYLKHLEGTDGLYEIRVISGNDIFRIFCFFDDGSLIIVLNGFQKKTQRTPVTEIERAKKLKRKYYEDKKR
ncbi:type II toxin-antitoxin system RelE/ParE family toxin [Danxiaibacter flavus]|uniref:Type II toxin-antitoxin system RelE/ParE family toxin n=1 Tax=Danxiaibacter flavus TaxID=3049108 RepID=A0ABV3ZKW8_9BACT|nr:type II toxin-antitoxin system RelE/ParE family toxin [Chitinophagaceae bacterium DXS]